MLSGTIQTAGWIILLAVLRRAVRARRKRLCRVLWWRMRISFIVRFCRAAERVSSNGFRIVFREELYDILAIDHLNYKKKALKFRCRKVRR